ncbi:YidC/Oxa1 family membrane protein insertase [Lentzea tibetensis]|uniref:Membrane protein insertase YidC n=1 Tax=Lentzea tibetensis TaxID=2591470 RepID=A0A563EXI3_9PSEU|nr:YidC/Oxa1 family membrane protein insertase [Lentzea tibetensis]TWP52447.1 YidC/Oxa1 family membrane protein insertase [Lentzea tibetensis]
MFHDLGSALAGLGSPALAIVLFTVAVRLLLHPLYRAAVRGEKAKAELAPEIRKLNKRYGKDLQKLSQETQKVYKKAGVSMFAGILPMLATIPFFMVMYRLVTTPNPLLDGTLFGFSLGTHFTSGYAWVFLVLFALLAVVAFVTVRWQKAQVGPDAPQVPFARFLRVLPYGTVLVAAWLPLAAGLYLLTTTSWTIAERALLYRILS